LSRVENIDGKSIWIIHQNKRTTFLNYFKLLTLLLLSEEFDIISIHKFYHQPEQPFKILFNFQHTIWWAENIDINHLSTTKKRNVFNFPTKQPRFPLHQIPKKKLRKTHFAKSTTSCHKDLTSTNKNKNQKVELIYWKSSPVFSKSRHIHHTK
jgi:hypothetical protein